MDRLPTDPTNVVIVGDVDFIKKEVLAKHTGLNARIATLSVQSIDAIH
jgi:hypothetical protein